MASVHWHQRSALCYRAGTAGVNPPPLTIPHSGGATWLTKILAATVTFAGTSRASRALSTNTRATDRIGCGATITSRLPRGSLPIYMEKKQAIEDALYKALKAVAQYNVAHMGTELPRKLSAEVDSALMKAEGRET